MNGLEQNYSIGSQVEKKQQMKLPGILIAAYKLS